MKRDARAAFLKESEWLRGLGETTPWKPLYCEHRGPGRVAHTPLVIRSERTDAGPRQEVLARLPTIRYCCIADRLARAAWWHDIDETFNNWRAGDYGSALLDVRRFADKMRDALRAVFPTPTRAGARDFEAYRPLRERERARREVEAAYRDRRARREQDRRRACAPTTRAWQRRPRRRFARRALGDSARGP